MSHTDQSINQSKAPRRVPLLVAAEACFGEMVYFEICYLLIIILILFLFHPTKNAVLSIYYFINHPKITEGVITDVRPIIDRDSRSSTYGKAARYYYYYTYNIGDRKYSAVSDGPLPCQFSIDDRVTVEYLPFRNSSISRIKGLPLLSTNDTGFILALIAFGLLFAICSVKNFIRGCQIIYLLRNGILTEAKLTSLKELYEPYGVDVSYEYKMPMGDKAVAKQKYRVFKEFSKPNMASNAIILCDKNDKYPALIIPHQHKNVYDDKGYFIINSDGIIRLASWYRYIPGLCVIALFIIIILRMAWLFISTISSL